MTIALLIQDHKTIERDTLSVLQLTLDVTRAGRLFCRDIGSLRSQARFADLTGSLCLLRALLNEDILSQVWLSSGLLALHRRVQARKLLTPQEAALTATHLCPALRHLRHLETEVETLLFCERLATLDLRAQACLLGHLDPIAHLLRALVARLIAVQRGVDGLYRHEI